MGHWKLASVVDSCGTGQGHRLEPGEAVYVVAGRVIRCLTHLPAHVTVDAAAIDALRHAQDAEGASHRVPTPAAAAPPRSGRVGAMSSFAETVAPTRMQRGLTKRGIRTSVPKRPRPFASVAGVPDPKSDAYNR